ncbi:MAG: Klebsiella phage vB KleM RaK2 [Bacteroidota bacterium]
MLFKKAILFTDIHYGAKNNSNQHNIDCFEFVTWMIDLARREQCDTCIFLGDYHNNRSTMNLKTMSYAVESLELLSENFTQTFFILGNHDLFFKDTRDIHSAPWAKHINNVTVIHKPTVIEDVLFCPWLVGTEWKNISKKKGKYVFGHFELPHFFMNAMIEMPNYGEIQLETFKNFELGFSGHFHKRQNQKNMHYIGNTFPHNFADAWDDNRGVCILEWGKEPEFYTWEDQPTFRTLKLSRLIDEAATIIKPKQHLKVVLDIDISYEEASFIKETFMSQYELRELAFLSEKKVIDLDTSLEVQTFVSVDQIVIEGLNSLESDTFDIKTLTDIYNEI